MAEHAHVAVHPYLPPAERQSFLDQLTEKGFPFNAWVNGVILGFKHQPPPGVKSVLQCTRDWLANYANEAVRQCQENEDPRTTARRLSHAAGLLRDLGRIDEAVALFRQALKLVDLDTALDSAALETFEELGDLLSSNPACHAEAEQVLLRALHYRTQLSSDSRAEHAPPPQGLVALNSLAKLYIAKNELKLAGHFLGEAIAKSEQSQQKYGDWHPITVNLQLSMAQLHQARGDYPRAEERLQKAVGWREQLHGKQHPLTLSTIFLLGLLYLAQDKVADARDLFQTAHDGFLLALGEAHIDTKRARSECDAIAQECQPSEASPGE